MAFTLRQLYITLKKIERETHSESQTSKTFTEKKKKDDRQVHTGPAGTDDSSCDRRRRRDPPPHVSSAHTGHKRERREGEVGRAGRERKYGGRGEGEVGGGGGSLLYYWNWEEIGSMAGAACLWLRSGHVSTLWLLIFVSSQQSRLFDCLLIGQFVVFKQPREDSI